MRQDDTVNFLPMSKVDEFQLRIHEVTPLQ